MPLTKIEAMLKRHIGLDATSVGRSAVKSAVMQRMQTCDIADLQAYLGHLHFSGEELSALVDAVVVPETWFFRDEKPFAALRRHAKQVWRASHDRDVLRVLSVPCSSGEEPYSIAMTLLDSGLPADRFCIDAFDVSLQALERARDARYGDNSFRGRDTSFRDRHFDRVADRYRPHDRVRARVNFAQGNLLDDAFVSAQAQYEIIFCRNLLIYFDAETQRHAFATLNRLLVDEGLLCLGHADTGRVPSEYFTPIRPPGSFAFQKTAGERDDQGRQRAHATAESRQMPVPATVTRTEPPPTASADPGLYPRATPEPIDRLDQVQRLADQGLLDEARTRCEAYVSTEGPSARAYYLLGLIATAQDDQAAAEANMRKAVYLDPFYHEALVHLALLAETRKDAAGAAQFQRRATRSMARRQVTAKGIYDD